MLVLVVGCSSGGGRWWVVVGWESGQGEGLEAGERKGKRLKVSGCFMYNFV